jgi:glycosyltransferase involved in cell wall biosynthesis
MKVIIIGALPESLINFRGELLFSLAKKKLSIVAMASSSAENISLGIDNVLSMLKKNKIAYKSYPVQRNGVNLVSDLYTWKVLRNEFKLQQPDIILAYTIKPIIWGGLASRVSPKTHFYALVTGLGFAFQGKTWKRRILTRLITLLYKASLKNTKKVIFQNPDNLQEFISRNIVPKEKCELVNGSGVDIEKFSFTPSPQVKPIIFLTIGRLLGEKGFREYAQAAKLVKKQYPEVIFQLLGPEDPSPDGLSIKEVDLWQKNEIIDYLGSTSDVLPYLQGCHIYVLPSYHEGMPRTVLEAMAIGRPILTTDVPGCRETVINGENGYLVPKSNAKALAERMIWFIENSDQWERMGNRSRQFAEEKYDVHKVNAKLMEIMGL